MQLDCVEALKNLIRRLDVLRTQVRRLQTYFRLVYLKECGFCPKHTDFANNLLKDRDAAFNVKAKVSLLPTITKPCQIQLGLNASLHRQRQSTTRLAKQ